MKTRTKREDRPSPAQIAQRQRWAETQIRKRQLAESLAYMRDALRVLFEDRDTGEVAWETESVLKFIDRLGSEPVYDALDWVHYNVADHVRCPTARWKIFCSMCWRRIRVAEISAMADEIGASAP